MNNVLAVFDLARFERTERNMEFLNATEIHCTVDFTSFRTAVGRGPCHGSRGGVCVEPTSLGRPCMYV